MTSTSSRPGTPPAMPLLPAPAFVERLVTGEGAAVDPAPRAEELARLARLTALRQDADGRFYQSNGFRGALLYALVRLHRPRTILEIGTGRGYGALSMAMAADDAGVDTRIVTVDMLPPERRQPWAIDDERGRRVESLSLRDVWPRLPEAWTSRVTCLTGPSTDALAGWLADRAAPAVDFAFIDGGHDYHVVRHDVAAALAAGRGGSVTLLLDDYGGVQGRDVRRFVDDSLEPALAPVPVVRLDMPQDAIERRDNGEHGMVYVDGRGGGVTIARAFADGPSLRRLRTAASAEGLVGRVRYAVGTSVRRMLGRGRG